jgi:cell division protease FtsH
VDNKENLTPEEVKEDEKKVQEESKEQIENDTPDVATETKEETSNEKTEEKTEQKKEEPPVEKDLKKEEQEAQAKAQAEEEAKLEEELEEKKKEKEDLKKELKRVLKSNNDPENENGDGSGGGKKLNVNFKNIVLILFLVVMIISIPNFLNSNENQTFRELPYTEFVKQAENGNYKRIDEKEAYVYAENVATNEKVKARMITNRISHEEQLMKAISENQIEVKSLEADQMPFFITVFISWFPMLLLIFIWIFMLNRMNKGSGGGGPQIFSMGKSKTKEGENQKVKVTFDEVAGAEESKQELKEVVEFLKEPKKFQRAGAKIPKGVLLMGAPGTGKTLLAKAVAGEANVPFFSMSGSEFVEMFVGVGASRVRDLFAKARKNSPCIVFIDEIDAVGRKRGSGQGGGNDEREQTLNQLLVEMDGFGNEETIIILAATNRPEILDKALRRPGRFDRSVIVDRPDRKGREAILQVHAKNKKFASDVDFNTVAKKTAGFVGADLANLLNEAAILAARDDRMLITMADLEEASEKVAFGPEKRSKVMLDKDKINTAYHEIGHTLVNWVLPHTDIVHKVTIVPRGGALGYMMALPGEDKISKSKDEYISELQVLLAGRAAEEIVFGDITTGAGNDIERATKIAQYMVTKIGMSEKFGPVLLDDSNEGDWFKQRIYSEATAKEVDEEIQYLINSAYDGAKKIIIDNVEIFEKLAKVLFEKETIMSDELEAIIGFPQLKSESIVLEEINAIDRVRGQVNS